jgi:hypothetical protein
MKIHFNAPSSAIGGAIVVIPFSAISAARLRAATRDSRNTAKTTY